jgi:mono/diheme cytochrome c family protein
VRHGAIAALALGLGGCSAQPAVDRALERMTEQPRYDVYERSGFFPNGAAMQAPPEGTVPRGKVLEPRLALGLETGGGLVREVPLPVTAELLTRGRSRFEIFCAVCHGAGGYGGSVVAQNMGERRPPSLRTPELRALPAGYHYRIIRDGLGRMPSYAAELSVRDRWAVVAYLRMLQRGATLAPEEREDSIWAARLSAVDPAARSAP